MAKKDKKAFKGKEDKVFYFAINKWTWSGYDPDEFLFPGAEFVDGTVEGAIKAGLDA